MYMFTKEPKRLLNLYIVDEFWLIFSSIKVVSLQLGRGLAKSLVQNHTEAFCVSFLHY